MRQVCYCLEGENFERRRDFTHCRSKTGVDDVRKARSHDGSVLAESGSHFGDGGGGRREEGKRGEKRREEERGCIQDLRVRTTIHGSSIVRSNPNVPSSLSSNSFPHSPPPSSLSALVSPQLSIDFLPFVGFS